MQPLGIKDIAAAYIIFTDYTQSLMELSDLVYNHLFLNSLLAITIINKGHNKKLLN